MKIKLIAPAPKPEWGESFWDQKTLVKMTPWKAPGTLLALPTLASLTPSGVEVVITDENIEPIDFDEGVDLVGISFITSLAPRAYEIADQFRASGVKVVLGGIHASMLPDEAIQHADSVVIGEAEDSWPRLVADFKQGKLQEFYEARHYPSLEDLRIPRWDLLKTDAYSYFTIQTSRGCPYRCDFCSVQVFNGRKYRHKPIENVVKEIKLLQKIDSKRIIFFADDNFLASPIYAKKLMSEITSLNIRVWWCQTSINRLKDDELLDLMFKSGCQAIFVGFESILKRSIELINKSKVNSVEEYREIIKKVQTKGIAIIGSFVIGGEEEDKKIYKETIEFINRNNIAFAMVNILTPLPGTNLFQRLKTAGRILHENWHEYNLEKVCFKHNPALGDLLKGRSSVIKEIYSYSSLYKRLKYLRRNEVFIRNKKGLAGFISKRRIMLSLYGLKSIKRDIKRTWFILKSLWNKKASSMGALMMALSVHDYAFKKLQNDK